MSGLGHKVWTRERLTSADLQGYIQDQVVTAWASRSARTAGLAAPDEGMPSYLIDEQVLETFSGGAWRMPAALGTVLHASQAAGGAAADVGGTSTRVTGTANASVTLYPGRLYECRMGCGLQAGTAASTHEANVRAVAGAGPPVAASTMVAAARAYLAGAGTSFAWFGEATGPEFTVTAVGEHSFAPFFNRTAGAGTTQLTVHPARLLLWIKVDDLGSVAMRAQRQLTNEDALVAL